MNRRRLGLEALEDRRLLAVTVGLDPMDSTHVLVDGDSGANDIRVVRRRMGDVNFDGTVDIFDQNYVTDHWDETGPEGDADDDGIVGIFDALRVSDNYGAQQIQIFEGTTLKATYYETGGSAISLITIDAGDGDDTITVDGNMRIDVQVDGADDSDDTLKITGNKSADDFLDIDPTYITLFDATSLVYYENVEALDVDLYEHPNVLQSRYDEVWIHGTSGDDSITVDDELVTIGDFEIQLAEVEGLILSGSLGNDVVNAATIDPDIFLILHGNNGDDTLIGGAGDDLLSGQAGKDVLIGGAGNDSLTGGSDDDTYMFLPGLANLGSDSINDAASTGSDTINLEFLANNLTLNLQSTSVQGVASSFLNLQLQYNTSIENVIGGRGNDTFTGNTRANVLEGRSGTDTLYGYDGADALYGGDGNDTLEGQNDADGLFGGAGNDTLRGGAGNDYLHGEAGDDTLEGGTNDDTYVFRWYEGDDRAHAESLGSDTITDAVSSGSDTVDFSDFHAAYTAPNAATSGAQTVSTDILEITFSPTSTVETVTAPTSSDVNIRRLIVDMYSTADTIRLMTAGGWDDLADDQLTQVKFYWDSNRNGVSDAGDTLLATDTTASDGWAASVAANSVPQGTNTFFAIPTGQTSNVGPAAARQTNQLNSVYPLALNSTFVRSTIDSDVWLEVLGNTIATAPGETGEYFNDTDLPHVDRTQVYDYSDSDLADSNADGNAVARHNNISAAYVSTLTMPGFGVSGIAEMNTYTQTNDNVADSDGATAYASTTSTFASGEPNESGVDSHVWTLTQNQILGYTLPVQTVDVRGELMLDWSSIRRIAGEASNTNGGATFEIVVNADSGEYIQILFNGTTYSVVENGDTLPVPAISPDHYGVTVSLNWNVPMGTTFSVSYCIQGSTTGNTHSYEPVYDSGEVIYAGQLVYALGVEIVGQYT